MVRVYGYDLHKQGGNHLAAAREYLQCNIRGGDSCTWGSNQILHMTVAQIEEMASEIAAAAINEDRKNRDK